ncbi:hypothetical protein F2Q69_00044137 [Brassica cretica]|uniref:Uncharacterized protein n=1 Tax=Brassica cretica TaxID=69181 RepID=A0A8S9NEH2_BRACR|nr:hypothetical protein F2Q69_00044137 [Brassica cretica]
MAAAEADVSSTSNSRIPPEQLEQNRKDGESDDPTLRSLLEYYGDCRSEMVVQVETGDAKSYSYVILTAKTDTMVFHYFPLFIYVNAFTFQQIPATTEADVSSTSNSRIPPEQLEQNRKDGESDDPTLRSLLEYFGDYRSEMVVQNPGFDFSQAQFTGNCPDPSSFMGGIRSD